MSPASLSARPPPRAIGETAPAVCAQASDLSSKPPESPPKSSKRRIVAGRRPSGRLGPGRWLVRRAPRLRRCPSRRRWRSRRRSACRRPRPCAVCMAPARKPPPCRPAPGRAAVPRPGRAADIAAGSAPAAGGVPRTGAGRGPAAEQAAQETAAAAGRRGRRLLELLHPALQRRQRLLLHQDRLRHVVGCRRQARDLLADMRLGFGVALRRLAVDLPQLAEQLMVDRYLLLLIQHTISAVVDSCLVQLHCWRLQRQCCVAGASAARHRRAAAATLPGAHARRGVPGEPDDEGPRSGSPRTAEDRHPGQHRDPSRSAPATGSSASTNE